MQQIEKLNRYLNTSKVLRKERETISINKITNKQCLQSLIIYLLYI